MANDMIQALKFAGRGLFVTLLLVGCGSEDSAAPKGETGAGGEGGGGADTEPGPRFVGRVDASDPSQVRFAWQGAGVVATVSGPEIAVTLRSEGSSTVYFQPVIDGEPGERFNVDPGDDRTQVLATGLDEGEHVVELYRETEGMHGISTFLGFTTGEVGVAPPARERLIEVVGDSISAGYGNLGEELHPGWVADPACHWTAENSSWYATYAAVAGRALEAEVSTIARSGWGMVRDGGGNTEGVLSRVYENALGTDDSTPWDFERKADAVVINLGTNDWNDGDPGESYETAYISFLETVRGHYPDAFLLLTIGSMTGEPGLTEVRTRLAHVVEAVSEATGDERLLAFDLGVQNLGSDGSIPSGCDWHPSQAEHERMASVLEQKLRESLDW